MADSSSATRLAPCPFCGEQPRVKEWPKHSLRGNWEISCENVACAMVNVIAEENSEADAIAAWNRRVPAPPSAATESTKVERCPDGLKCHNAETGCCWGRCMRENLMGEYGLHGRAPAPQSSIAATGGEFIQVGWGQIEWRKAPHQSGPYPVVGSISDERTAHHRDPIYFYKSVTPLSATTRVPDAAVTASELLEAVRGWVHARAFSNPLDLLKAEDRLNETFRKVVGLDHRADRETRTE